MNRMVARRDTLKVPVQVRNKVKEVKERWTAVLYMQSSSASITITAYELSTSAVPPIQQPKSVLDF